MAFWDRFFGTAGSTAAGVAMGATAVPALRPAVQYLENEAWALHPDIPPQAYVLAEGVAQGQVDRGQAQTWANEQGLSDTAFAALVEIANVGPGASYAFQLWRRGIIGEAGFRRALLRMGLEVEWIDDLVGLKNELLSPAELANARQQGFVDEARQKSEAALQGITDERAEIQFELSGLPPGVDVGQRAANRNLIDRATFDRIVREGHTKTKYTDLLWAMRHPVLTAPVYATLHLKGWISEAEMNDGGALTGYTPEQMHLLYLERGRPATTHQVHIGYARGGALPGASGERDAFDTAVKQSDIRPEYADLLWASRYTLPTPFVMRTLTQTGVWSESKAADRLRQAGWIPEDADEAARAWATGGTGAGADPHVTKAQNQLWTATHSSYVKDRTDDATAQTKLAALGVAAGAIPGVLALWQEERELVRAGLTAAQIKKAYSEGTFTQAEAVARLVELGWSAADANVYLGE